MKKNFFETSLCVWKAFIHIGPFRLIRISALGARRVALFRAMHRREPTKDEWSELSMQAYQQVIEKPNQGK